MDFSYQCKFREKNYNLKFNDLFLFICFFLFAADKCKYVRYHTLHADEFSYRWTFESKGSIEQFNKSLLSLKRAIIKGSKTSIDAIRLMLNLTN